MLRETHGRCDSSLVFAWDTVVSVTEENERIYSDANGLTSMVEKMLVDDCSHTARRSRDKPIATRGRAIDACRFDSSQ